MLSIAHALSQFGMSMLLALDGLGRFASFSLYALRIAILEPRSWLRWRQIGPQLYSVGAASVLVVAITGAFIGMILALEGYDLSLIHISEPPRPVCSSRMPSSA
jgi:phospholipid/cholesterol/gamma-HCH transport system permease protein